MSTKTETKTEAVMCGNPDHVDHGRGPVKAVARVSWPGSHTKPTAACKKDLRWMAADAIRDGVSIHIDMIEES